MLFFGGVLVRGAQHHHRLHRLAAVTVFGSDDAGLLDGGVAEHQRLHLGRPDLEARRVDHAFEPVGQEEVAVFVHMPEVAGAEEALAFEIDEHVGRGFGPFPVAAKDLRPTDDDFALFALRQRLAASRGR